MRALPLAFCLCTTGAFAQLGAPNYGPATPPSTVTMGVQSFGPSLTGHLQGTLNALATEVDLNGDLGLGKDGAKTGFFFDYQSSNYGFQVSSGSTEYAGNQMVSRAVTVAGVGYPNGTAVQSRMKLSSLEGTWTIKFVNDQDTWVGLDLGLQIWTLDLNTNGLAAPSPARVSLKVPIPQVGLSAGSRAYNGAFESKATIRYMSARGGKYILLGTDFRLFLTRWFGLRTFYENSRFNGPKGSIKDDLEIGIDRKGIGFGGVVRF